MGWQQRTKPHGTRHELAIANNLKTQHLGGMYSFYKKYCLSG